jgi:hypothetical protein
MSEAKWLPIDSAPKDGSILVIVRGWEPAVAWWDHDLGRFIYCETCADHGEFVNCEGNDWPLTHWMPLPPPPETKP